MSCKRIDEFLDGALREPPAFFPGWVVEHCRACVRCRQLMALLSDRMPKEPAPPALQARIEAAVLSSLEPVSPLPPARAFVLQILGVFALLAFAAISLMGVQAVSVMSVWQFLGVGGVLAGGSIVLAISLSRQMTPGSYHRVPPAILILFFGAALLLAYPLLFPWGAASDFVSQGIRCALASSLLIVPGSAGVWFLVRRGAILSPGLAGATTGLFAGLLGATVLHFGCVIVEASHLLVWHAGMPVFSTVGGFLLGRFFGRVRRRKTWG